MTDAEPQVYGNALHVPGYFTVCNISGLTSAGL